MHPVALILTKANSKGYPHVLKRIQSVIAVSFALTTSALAAPVDDTAAVSHAPAPFVASTTKSFATLMGDAMSVMDYGMANAAMNGNPDHDFSAMMIPHHQGAIDMAKAELLYGKNPVLRRLAQEIIVTQESEITLMQMELRKLSPGKSAKP
jgi:uncharacterized protein (DUF305 family)